MTVFDLRSDTVTRPTPGMRRAMAETAVGDDVYGEDPTVSALQDRVASLLGKEAALFMPSGTMANQVALLCQTRPGDEVIVGRGAHCAFYESGAGGAFAGVQFEQTPGPLVEPEQVEDALKPRAYYCPRTSLLALENTHNRGGGIAVAPRALARVAEVARRHELAVHLDGARLWNASVALDVRPAALAEPFDTVSVCFSKGLGAPVGSMLCGTRALIDEALRYRKMLGGGMRQVGILAAAASYALDHHFERLALDHEAARRLGTRLAAMDGVSVLPVSTNIVLADVASSAARVQEQAEARGVRLSAFGPKQVRMVTHLDVVGDGFDEGMGRCVDAFAAAHVG
ncbi:MAG: threonine aldolase family protein [Myxococcota bacterium]